MGSEGETSRQVAVCVLAAPQLATGIWAAFAPHSFFRAIADFGPYDAHLVRDYGTFAAALGLVLLASARWKVLMPGALVVAATWSALHAVNHIVDFSKARTTGIAATSLGLLVLSALAYAFAAAMLCRARV